MPILFELNTNFNQKLPGYFTVSLLIIIAICIYCIIVGALIARQDVKKLPSKFLQLNLLFVKKINNFIRSTIGLHWRFIAPVVYGLIFFIFLSNISGMFGFVIPTSNTAINLPLAIISLTSVQLIGLKSKKIRHFKTLFEPMAFMFPINLIGDITPLISMTFRLFGNIISGTLLLTLVYSLTGVLSPILTPILHVIFDFGFGIIQTLVFVLLTVFFAKGKTLDSDEIEDTDENFLLEYQKTYYKKPYIENK